MPLVGPEIPSASPSPEIGRTKLDLVRYYLAVADGALTGVRDRPMAMKRFVDDFQGQG